jgi:hypothetical protein
MLVGLDDNDHRQPHPHPINQLFFQATKLYQGELARTAQENEKREMKGK